MQIEIRVLEDSGSVREFLVTSDESGDLPAVELLAFLRGEGFSIQEVENDLLRIENVFLDDEGFLHGIVWYHGKRFNLKGEHRDNVHRLRR